MKRKFIAGSMMLHKIDSSLEYQKRFSFNKIKSIENELVIKESAVKQITGFVEKWRKWTLKQNIGVMRCNVFDWNKVHQNNENIENEIFEHKMKTFMYTTWR